jgi:hypothetical protein
MNTSNGTVLRQQATPKQVQGHGRLPPGHRALYAHIPESVFNFAKAQALLSGMRFTEYLTRLLAEAKPYDVQRSPKQQGTA